MSNIDAMLQAAQSNAQAAVNSQPVTIDATPQYQQVQPQQTQQAQYQPQQAQQYQQPQQTQQAQPQYQQQPQQAQYQQQQAQPQYQQQPQQAQYQQQQAQQNQYIPQQAQQQYLPAQQQQQVPQQQQQAAYPQQQPMQAQLPAHLMALAGGVSITMEDIMRSGMAVDQWLKPDYQGMTLGDNTVAIQKLVVEIDMTEKQGFTPIRAIRYSENPVRYDYTTDGIRSKDGMPWMDVLTQAYAIDPKVSPYNAVQLPMTLLEDGVNLKNELVAAAGSRIGYTTPVTGLSAFQSLYVDVQKKGWLGRIVAVEITNEGKIKNGNRWGIVMFKLLGLAPSDLQAQQAQ